MTRLNIFILFLSLLLLSQNLLRDLQLQQLQLGDLRNRIVGARMQKDGLSPYFYKWKQSDDIRYYDPLSQNEYTVSSSTASPFIHTLLYPLTELPYAVASQVWIYVLYSLLLISALLAALLSGKKLFPLVCLVTLGFTYTETWLDTITTKQSYLLIPFFTICIFFLLKKGHQNNWLLAIAGIFSISLLLSRPHAVVFFLPLLFIQHRYSLSAKLSFLAPVIAGILLILATQKKFWSDYLLAMEEHVKIHQNLNPVVQENDAGSFTSIEGFNTQGYKNKVTENYTAYVEYGNFFVIIKLLSGYTIMPGELLLLCCTGILLCIMLFYYSQKKKGNFSLEALAILGFSLYMIIDIGAPVYRGHYNVIQWLFPLLMIPVTFQAKYNHIYIVIVVAFILNLHYKPFLPMQHVIGEYLWLAAFTIYSFVYKTRSGT